MNFQTFDKFPHPDKWDSFLTYSKRVKRLEICPGGGLRVFGWALLDDSVFQTVALSRPAINSMPNLRRIEIYHSDPHYDSILQQSIVFIHEGLQSLRVAFLSNDRPEALEAIVCNTISRAHQLQELQLLTVGSTSLIERPVSALLTSLKHLWNLELSSCSLTPSVLLSASRLPTRETLTIDKSTYECGGNAEDISFASFSIAGGFPRLVTLEIQGDISELSMLFGRSQTTFTQLRHLELDIFHHDNREGLRNCLHILKSACPLLTTLRFIRDVNVYLDLPFLERARAARPIESEDLTELKDFHRLEKFILACDKPVRMSDAELIALLSACPSLKAFDVNCEPIVTSSPTLTIGVLVELSSRFPALEELGLYVDPHIEDWPGTSTPFSKLRQICFGCSPEPIANKTAFFLGKLLPVGSVVDTAVRRYFVAKDDEARTRQGLLYDRRTAWASLMELLPMLIQARADGEENPALKAQMQELSAQNCKLRASEAGFRGENAKLRAQLHANGTWGGEEDDHGSQSSDMI